MATPDPASLRLPILGSEGAGRTREVREHRAEIPIEVGSEVEIQLGHMCNNRCRFCVSGQLTAQRRAGPQDAAPVIEALRHARARGATRVTLLGGEPTLQPAFFPALREAVSLGFDEVCIFTNGVKTARRAFAEQVVALGRFNWRFSIQGGNEEAHDAVTEKPGSYARLIQGVRHLADMGQDLTANACINEFSYRSSPDYVELVREHGLRQLHLDIVRPSDAGERTDEHLRSIISRYSDMAPYFAQMLEGFEAFDPEYDVNLGNFPFCLLPKWTHKIHHDGRATATVSADGDGLSEEWNKYADKRFDKIHVPACETCLFRSRCNGVFTKYLEFYGDAEFAPITAQTLAEADPQMRAFGLHLGSVFAGLEGLRLPTGWAFGDRVDDDREARVRWELRRGSESLWVHFVRVRDLRERARSIFIGPRFAVEFGPTPESLRRHVPALARALQAALRRLEGGGRTSGRKASLPVPQDITLPVDGSETARRVLSASLGRLLRDLKHLRAPAGADAADLAQWGDFVARLAKLARHQPGALASVFRWTHVSTLARCLLRARAPSVETAREFALTVTFDLWCAGAVDHGVHMSRLPPTILSLPQRRRWVIPAEIRELVFDGALLRCVTADIEGTAEISREEVRAGRSLGFEAAALPIRGNILLALHDNNPIAEVEAHPDKEGNALDLGGREAKDWVASLDAALALIELYTPRIYAEMQLYVQQVVPVGYDERLHLSASYAEAIGTLYMSLHPKPMVLAEALIHEFSHNKLNALFELDPVLENAFTSMHQSPVRPDLRPLHGVLLAAHAFLPVAALYEAMVDAGVPESERPDFRRRLAQIVSSNHEAVSVVLGAGRPTRIGRGVLEEMRRLDAHFMSRFFDASVAAADLG